MMQGLRELWGKIQYNIKRVMDSDPAATSVWMVIWTYPHITALFWHFAHRLYKAGDGQPWLVEWHYILVT